eukprot:scaffold1963_cov120-Isochrysis_galbana.AAC.4
MPSAARSCGPRATCHACAAADRPATSRSAASAAGGDAPASVANALPRCTTIETGATSAEVSQKATARLSTSSPCRNRRGGASSVSAYCVSAISPTVKRGRRASTSTATNEL